MDAVESVQGDSMDFSLSEVNTLLGKLELPIGVAGFVLGAMKDDLKTSTVFNTLTTEGKAKYIIHALVGKMTGYDVFSTDVPTLTGAVTTLTPVKFKFNPMGFLNKYAAIAAFSYLWKELGGPYASTISKILWPLGVGGAIGGFFDPDGGPALQTTAYNPTLTGVLVPVSRGSVW